MSYTVLNQAIFTAAFAGAIAGMGSSERVPTDTSITSTSQTNMASIAGAYAQSVDTAWGNFPSTQLDVAGIQEASAATWEGRTPAPVAPFFTPSTYTGLASALIAQVKAGDAYMVAQGIPSVFSPNSVALIVGSWFVDPANTSGLANDANNGRTALTPLLTYESMTARWGNNGDISGLNGIVNVTAMSDAIPVSSLLSFRGVYAKQGIVKITGTPVVVSSGTLSAFAALNRATGALTTVTDSVGAAWANLGGPFAVKITSGAQIGAEAIPLIDDGAGALRTEPFAQPVVIAFTAPTAVVLAGNETYNVIRRTQLPALNIDITAARVIGVDHALLINECAVGNGTSFGGLIAGSGTMVFAQTFLTNVTIQNASFYTYVPGSCVCSATFYGCNSVSILGGGSKLSVDPNIVFVNCASVMIDNDFTMVGGRLRFTASNWNIGNWGTYNNGAGAVINQSQERGSRGVFEGATSFCYGLLGTLALFQVPESEVWQYRSGYTFQRVATAAAYDFLLGTASGGSGSVIRTDTGAYQAPVAYTFAKLLAAYGAPGFGGNIIALSSNNTGFVLANT